MPCVVLDELRRSTPVRSCERREQETGFNAFECGKFVNALALKSRVSTKKKTTRKQTTKFFQETFFGVKKAKC